MMTTNLYIGGVIAPFTGARAMTTASLPFPRRRVINNLATGDRLTILRSAGETGGASSLIRFDLPPGAKGSPLHYHTRIAERFT